MRRLRSITPISIEGYNLFHEGTLALMDIERRGWPVDVPYLEKTTEWAGREIKKKLKKINQHKEIDVWKSLYGNEFNIDSDDQLRVVLFDKMGHTPSILTKKEKPSTSAEALELLKVPFVKDLIGYRKLRKVKVTYLDGILREQVGGIIHASFGLSQIKTFRSRCGNPNLQNIPAHDAAMAELVRKAFRADPDCMIVEVDYSGAEVRVGCGYHLDPTMIDYVLDDSTDMHRDMAAECYYLEESDITKPLRNSVKGDFVFAAFYGSFYKLMAPKLWKSTGDLQTVDGQALRTHLREHGIKGVKSFTKHIGNVEKDFWEERFPVYADWKDHWYQDYLIKGYADMLTGFRYSGVAKRNEVINAPIQGSAFHCLLWALNRTHEELPTINPRNRILGQVHDSLILNVHPKDKDDVLALVKEISTERVRKHWDWINVPMEIEAEASPVDGTWFDKTEIAI